jgi:hypothetical protein
MAIKSDSAGGLTTLSFESHIVPEFITDGGLASALRPHSLSEYYVGGTAGVPVASPQNDNIPTSGTIQFSDFYGATAQITVELSASNLSGGSLNLYSLAQSIGGATPINNEITTPYVFVITGGMNVYNTIYTGGNFADLIIEIESGARVWGRGADGNSTSNNPAIWVSTSMGSLEIINDGWLAAGGAGGSNSSGSYTVPAPPGLTFVCTSSSAPMTVSFTAGGGGGQGGGNGAGSSASSSGSLSAFSYSKSAGSGNQTGGNGSTSSATNGLTRPVGGTTDRITTVGTAGSGTGGSGGGKGGGVGLVSQNNAEATDATQFGISGGGGGGSQQTPSNGAGGTATAGTINGQGGNCWNIRSGSSIGGGGRAWGTGGSRNTIHNTGAASSYTLTNNGTMY